MNLIVISTILEADHLLKRIRIRRIKENLFSCDEANILICGIGTYQALGNVLTELHSKHYKHLWNIGIAGSFKDHKLAEVLTIEKIDKNIFYPRQSDHSKAFSKNAHPTIYSKDVGSHLLTSDYPIHWKEDHLLEYDCVDMEGYGIGIAASSLNLPFKMTKIVSDFTNAHGPRIIREQIDFLSSIIAQEVEKELYSSTNTGS